MIKETERADVFTLEGFIQAANDNSIAYLQSGDVLIEKCRGVDQVFSKVIKGFADPKPIAPIFFLLRAHSAFLGAVRLSLAGELPESYMVMRGVLENALYAFFVFDNPEMANIWIKRDEDPKAVRDNFRIGTMKTILATKDSQLEKIVGELYERTIDYGAHPNVLATTTNTDYRAEVGRHHFQANYLSGLSQAFHVCLKSCPQIGLAALSVFAKIYPVRFQIDDVLAKIESLKEGL